MNLKEFRASHPEYDDMGDAALATALHRKFYSDMPVGDFYKSVGLATDASSEATGSASENFLAGVGKGFVDIGRAIGQPLGLVSQEEIEASRQRDTPLLDTAGGITGNVVGTAAPLALTAFIPGANTLAGASLIGAGGGAALTPGTLGERAVSGLAGAAGGAAGHAIGTGIGALGRKVIDNLSGNVRPNLSPKTIKDAASLQYKMARNAGVEIASDALERTGQSIVDALEKEGYRKTTAPKVFGAISELAGKSKASLDDLEAVRRALSKAGVDYAESDAARRAIGALDDFAHNLNQSDLLAGDAAKANALLGEARANYGAYKRADTLNKAISKANLQASSAGSGANIDNAIRQQFKSILNSPKKSAGFSPAELEQMRKVVSGTKGGNAARLLGKLAPRGVVSAGLSGGPALYLGGAPAALGTWALGEAGKFAGDQSTKRGASKAVQMALERAPILQDLLSQYQMNLAAPGLLGASQSLTPALSNAAAYGLLQQRF